MAAPNFITCAGVTLRMEGGLVNNPADPGGLTNFGIAAADHPGVDIADLAPLAALPYYQPYWAAINGDSLPLGVDLALFDFSFNAGAELAAKRLQSVVGVRQDGDIGPITLAALAKATKSALIMNLTYLRIAYYETLANYPTFGAGWIKRAERIQTMALAMISVG